MGIARNATATAWFLALTLIIFSTSCGGDSSGSVDLISGLSDTNSVSVPTVQLPGLPGLDLARELSTPQALPVSPLSYQLSGGTVTQQAPSVLLDSSAKTASWALYAYNTEGNDIFNLTLTFQYPNGPGAWVALANYETGRWEWKPKNQLTQAVYSISPATGRNYTSPQGFFYFLVVSYDGADVKVTDIKVVTDVPPPPTYSISGRVVDGNAAGLSGILIGLNVAGTTTTDGNGNFSFTGMAPGSYTVTPQDAGFNYAPKSMVANVIDKDVNSINFVATPVQQTVTYVDDIAPLFDGAGGTEKACTQCHSGSFPDGNLKLETYQQVSSNSSKITPLVNETDSKAWMPKDGPKWSQAHLDLWQAWLDGGKVEQ